MEKDKVSLYLTTNMKYFPGDKMTLIREKLEQLDDERYLTVSSIELKDPTTMLLVSILPWRLRCRSIYDGRYRYRYLETVHIGIVWDPDGSSTGLRS